MRAATGDDVELLVSLMTGFYAEAGYELDRPHAAHAFRTLIEDPRLGYVWILEQENLPVGHLVLTLRYGMEYGGLIGCLDDLYVDRIGAEEVLLPRHAETHDVMASGQETFSVVEYSGCAADSAAVPMPSKAASILPENYKIRLALDDSIDSQTAAAGDVISATVVDSVAGRDGGILLPQGARVRGRILNLGLYSNLQRVERRNAPPEDHLLVAISFDVVEVDGVASPLRVRLDRVGSTTDDNRWPEDTLVFATTDKKYVVPRGFKSTWIAIK
jgi:hypothetical protein